MSNKKFNTDLQTSSTQFFWNHSIESLNNEVANSNIIFITDSNLYQLYKSYFEQQPTIVIPAGEANKIFETWQYIINKLIEMRAQRQTTLIGVGGGVLTDLAGFAAATYMRGIPVGFVPTTILAMVDAAIGGKNGIDVGVYKNLAGAFKQPLFINYDYRFLQTLPYKEWINGFAEIVKHAAIADVTLFDELQQHNVPYYQANTAALDNLIQANVRIKNNIVFSDPYEQNQRRLLNFGHTLGHAIENNYQLMHGQAIAIGMVFAGYLSEQLLGFSGYYKLVSLLRQYELPVFFDVDVDLVFDTLVMDKKAENDFINFVLLKQIGEAIVQPIEKNTLKLFLQNFFSNAANR